MRRTFYNAMVNSRDENIQKKGIVCVAFSAERKTHPSQKPRESVWAVAQLVNVMPIRLTAAHFCYDNAVMAVLGAIARVAVNTFTRVRVRTHYGKS